MKYGQEVQASSMYSKVTPSMLPWMIQQGRVPGTVVLIARNGKIAYWEAIGKRDPAKPDKLAKDDIKPPEARDRRRDPGPLQWMKCCRCGDRTKGRQWWNRDTGYGICPPCVQRQRDRGTSSEEILELYGQEGIHWGKSAVTAGG